MSQPNHHPDIQDFIDWLRDNRVPGLVDPSSKEPAYFVPQASLRKYFQEQGNYNLKKLLKVVFDGKGIPVDPDEVAKHYSSVFCILLLVDKPKFIQSFVQRDKLQDKYLPFNAAFKPEGFPKDPSDKDENEFLARFCENQMAFCAPVLDYHTTRTFEPDRILPITFVEPLAPGGSSNTYKILLNKSYNSLRNEDGSLPPGDIFANHFVLKTYSGKAAKRYFDNEVDGFQRLRNSHTSSMVGFFGSFRQGDRYNIILEYADKGTLEQYFKKIPPPKSGEDILKCWRGLFTLLEALYAIHEGHEESTQLDVSQPLRGWHQDVKPENILLTSLSETIKNPYEWHFKLADLGISHFKSLNDSLEGNPAQDQDSQGTRTYGAPECCRIGPILQKVKINIKNNVDVWSLGAVYSEAAVWLVDGYEGLKTYRRARRAATKRVPGLKDSDCFHDGDEMLSVVRQTHKDLCEGRRIHDVVTEPSLNYIIDDMLLDARSRPNTITFLRKSEKILEKAKSTLERKNSKGVSTLQKPVAVEVSESSQSSHSSSPASGVLDTGQSIYREIGRTANDAIPHGHSPESMGRTHADNPHFRREPVWNHPAPRVDSYHGQSNYYQAQGLPAVTDEYSDLNRSSSQGERGKMPAYTSHGIGTVTNGSSGMNFTPHAPPRSNTQQTYQSPHMSPLHQGSFPIHQSGRGTHRGQQAGSMRERNQVMSLPPQSSSGVPFDEEAFQAQYGRHTLPAGRHSQVYGESSHTGFGSGAQNREDRGGRGTMDSYSSNPATMRDFNQSPPPTTTYQDHGIHSSAGGYEQLPRQEFERPPTVSPPPLNRPFTAYSNEDQTFGGSSYLHQPNSPPKPGSSNGMQSPLKAPIVQPFVNLAADTQNPSSSGINSPAIGVKVDPQQRPSDTPSPAPPASSLPPQVAPSLVKVEPPAVLPVSAAITWRARKKKGENVRLDGDWLFSRIQQRDHIFIVDDSASMEPHWNEMMSVFEILAYIVKEADDDGIDLYFTMSPERHHHKHASPLVDIVKKRRPRGTSEISFRLEAILDRYKSRLHDQQGLRRARSVFASKKDVRPLNLYIFTDGAWQHGSDAAPAIRLLVEALNKLGLQAKQVGIQFISFGENKANLERLEHLDDGLGLDYDIVDTTPSNGNVWKMLLGAIDPAFDDARNTTFDVPKQVPAAASIPPNLFNNGRR